MNVRHKGFPVFSIFLLADVVPVTREYAKNRVINHVPVLEDRYEVTFCKGNRGRGRRRGGGESRHGALIVTNEEA